MVRMAIATDRDALSQDAQRVYDEVVNDRGSSLVNGRLPGPVAAILPYAPEIAGRLSHLGTAIRFQTSLSRADTELATIVAARGRNCEYVWAAHAPAAVEAGVKPEVVEVVNTRGPLDSLSADEALIVRFGRELVEQTSLLEETFQAAKARFGENGVIELTALIGYYVMISCVLTTVGLEPRSGAPPLKL
jgi:4-carboxymuconolactone decarboxylase